MELFNKDGARRRTVFVREPDPREVPDEGGSLHAHEPIRHGDPLRSGPAHEPPVSNRASSLL